MQRTLPLEFTDINLDASERRQGHLGAVFGSKTDCGAVADRSIFNVPREGWNTLLRLGAGLLR
ncbi:MAG: hypothetical protein AAFX99_00135 [Myxococcota bacterium]